jgi:hypothetical protein
MPLINIRYLVKELSDMMLYVSVFAPLSMPWHAAAVRELGR